MAKRDEWESEASTRGKRIDPKLRAAGWEIAGFATDGPFGGKKPTAVTEFETANGPADYALAVDKRILGVVEGKKVARNAKVLTQAERYSKGMTSNPFNFRGYRVPFLYSTNGEQIHFHDVRHALNTSRKLAAFHTPSALEEMLDRDFDAECDRLAETPNSHERLRPYQREANAAVEQAIRQRKRQMLVAMATGTGKTFTTVNQVYRLMKSGVARRVLFLVDRKVLAAQAVRAFAAFDPEPNLKFDKIYEVYSQRFRREDFADDDKTDKFEPTILPSKYLTDPKKGHAFVYVCTIQRMAMNLFGREVAFGTREETEDDADKLDIPSHAFDLIIADECHRGYTTAELSVWRNTLDHFDAIKIGLTATPAAHTKAYFEDVVFRYDYERAVREGFLVDYDVITIKSNVKLNGLFLKEGDQVKRVDTTTGAEQLDLLEAERQYEAGDIEKLVTAPESNRKIVAEIKKYADEHAAKYGRFPKTLIFAANDLDHRSHADQLVKLCVDAFGRGEEFVRKITGKVDRPLQRIREFRNRPNPGVVVSVDLMSTGVDIPDLEFIVFLRAIQSRILFEQMLGRGTRKGANFPDKSHFTVFDCFDGTLLAYFRNASAFTIDPPDKPARSLEEVIADIWDNKDRDYNVKCLVKRLLRVAKEMSGDAREAFKAFVPDGDIAAFAGSLPGAIKRNFTATMKKLKDPEFVSLLENFPRASSDFVVADAAGDYVTSEQWTKDAAGNLLKPQDYLQAFSRFVKENPSHIEAIRILLKRPQDWGTEPLQELREKLAATRERFTEENLQKAVKVRYDKSLADIISIIKRAASDEEPLLTARERVEKAMERIVEDKKFTEAQKKWIDRIREHLIKNLSIEKEDFEIVPVFTHAGGWKQADRVFDGKLEPLLKKINAAIAA
ncbi:MAG: DEAD/DEAH box helicase family protein [Planctomycetia bacterium]|nr:DEAD/DEAH box helicase family protein [Planctomycetia bacterium]